MTMRGWVLYKDSRHEISPDAYEINRFIRVAEESGIDLRVMRQEQFDLIVTRGDRKGVIVDGAEAELPHFLLPRRGAATTYYCLAIIRHLERLGVYAVNKSSSIETVRDKLYTQQILAASDLPFARTMLVKYPVDVDLVERTLGFPLVVKTISGSQGKGVFLAENRGKLEDIMNFSSASNSSVSIILQEFVGGSFGRDLRVITIGGRAIACMKRTAAAGDFKANFSRGGAVEAYKMTPEIEWLAAEASRVFDLDVAGVDLLFDGDHFKICEVNSSPGFKGMESCHTLSIPKQIYAYIRVRLGLHD